LSSAAISASSSMAQQRIPALAGGMLPRGSSSQRLLNPSALFNIAPSTLSKQRRGPPRWMATA